MADARTSDYDPTKPANVPPLASNMVLVPRYAIRDAIRQAWLIALLPHQNETMGVDRYIDLTLDAAVSAVTSLNIATEGDLK